LLIPGTLALVTAFVTFITLLLIPIPMVRELAVAAALGVAYKIVTNLMMLPLAASYANVGQAYAQRQMQLREARAGWLRRAGPCGRTATRSAWCVLAGGGRVRTGLAMP
jgi:predicted RND superfamily exporter protein